MSPCKSMYSFAYLRKNISLLEQGSELGSMLIWCLSKSSSHLRLDPSYKYAENGQHCCNQKLETGTAVGTTRSTVVSAVSVSASPASCYHRNNGCAPRKFRSRRSGPAVPTLSDSWWPAPMKPTSTMSAATMGKVDYTQYNLLVGIWCPFNKTNIRGSSSNFFRDKTIIREEQRCSFNLRAGWLDQELGIKKKAPEWPFDADEDEEQILSMVKRRTNSLLIFLFSRFPRRKNTQKQLIAWASSLPYQKSQTHRERNPNNFSF